MKWPIIIGLILSSWIAQAHQADLSSTMLVEQKDGSWIFQVRAALTAFEYEVNTHYGKDSFSTPEEFKELVIKHLKENIAVYFNEQDAAIFQHPYVKLGHETNVIFKIMNVPKTFNTISVKNSSFKNIHKNQSALIVLKEGFSKEQFILSGENNHLAKLKVGASKFVLLSNSNKQNNNNKTITWSIFYIIIFATMFALSLIFRKKLFKI